MRMGKANKKRSSRVSPVFAKKPTESSSPSLVVGQVSSNLIASIYLPILSDLAIKSSEQYANQVLDYNERLKDYGASTQGQQADISTANGTNITKIEKPIKPLEERALFANQAAVDEFKNTVLLETYRHFSSQTNEWKVYVNAAKFERQLDEKYGFFRPFITNHPAIEIFIKNLQRKVAKGYYHPLKRGDPVMPKSTAVILLFIMHRNGVRLEAVCLSALFFLIGLQPWALVTLVAVGHVWFAKRKRTRVGGMAETIKVVEPYYRNVATASNMDSDDEDEKERKRKYDLLLRPVGTLMETTDFKETGEKEGDNTYDTLILGSGPSTLYTAALLARTGRTVLVLSPEVDASGCLGMTATNENAKSDKFLNVPFDVHANNVAHAVKQQRLLVPALCTSTDAQGGIRFAQIGSNADGYAHDILSIPGMGVDGGNESIPFILRAGGSMTVANDAAMFLGDGWPNSAEGDNGNSTSAGYLDACNNINSTASHFYLSKLLPDAVNGMRKSSPYQEASVRYASTFLNKCLPLSAHVRSLMAGIGMRGENLPPSRTSMGAHVTNVCSACAPEGYSYPVGGPRALCYALATVIEQNGGKIICASPGDAIAEFLFEKKNESVDDADLKKKKKKKKTKEEEVEKTKAVVETKDGEDAPHPDAPRCIGVKTSNGSCITVGSEDGNTAVVVSMLGFVSTFIHLMPEDVRSKYGVPRGLPALSERRPLMKLLIGLRGNRSDLSLTGADWYRLPNASLPRDEIDSLTGQVSFGEIGAESGEFVAMDNNDDLELATDQEDGESTPSKDIDATATTTSTLGSVAGRTKRAKAAVSKKPKRNKFVSGSSWMKVSFPSAKDPSWNDRYGDISTCVVTVEADDDFVRMFDTKPVVFSNLKCGGGEYQRFVERVLKDLMDNFPQVEADNIEYMELCGPIRAGLSHNPERYAAKGVRPDTLYPGLFVGGSDLTVGDSFSGSIVGGWLVANAVMGYSTIDHVFLQKNITNDLEQFMEEPKNKRKEEDIAVPFKAISVSFVKEESEREKKLEETELTAEPSKEE